MNRGPLRKRFVPLELTRSAVGQRTHQRLRAAASAAAMPFRASRNVGLRLDPLSPIINHTVGAVLEFSKHYDEAIEQYMKTLELEPNFIPAHVTLVSAYWKRGMYEEAFAALKTSLSLRGQSELVGAVEKAYSKAGFKGAAKAAAEKREALSKYHYFSPYVVAYLYSYAEMGDRAMSWLERAYREGHMAMVFLKVGPWWDPWRSDPRYQDRVRRMDFPP